jgi:hypothetical protein
MYKPLVFFTLLLFPAFVFSLSNSATTTVDLNVDTGISYLCNQNGICELNIGETENNCFTDCGCNYNYTCEPSREETSSNCPTDCGGITIIYDTTPPAIYNITVKEITLNSALIFWSTKEQAVCKLSWGETSDLEKQIISEDSYFRNHSTRLKGLSPSTTYFFKITCRDSYKNKSESETQQFKTLAPPDLTPPSNVSNFEAVPGDKKITLKWQNPPEEDFYEVKILRSEKFYPTSPSEGYVVYTGRGESFEDTNLTNGITYYYTAFSYDKAGNYSSGAVVSATPEAPLPPEKVPPAPPGKKPPAPPGKKPPVTKPPTKKPKPPVAPPTLPPPPSVEKIELKDFEFYQGFKKLPLLEGKELVVKEKEPLTIAIKYEKVPEVLKTIMVTMRKGSKYFSFLLRINKDKTGYTAKILPPEPGIYPIEIYVLDYKNQALKLISGTLKVEGLPYVKVSDKRQFYVVFYLMLALILLLIVWYLFSKKREKKRSEIKGYYFEE